MDNPTVSDNPDTHRFELRKEGVVAAWTEYELLPNAVKLTHTEVLPQFGGQGLSSKLASFALGDVRRRGLQVVPMCEFIAGYIRKHPEYLDLVSDESRREFKL